MWHSMLKKKMTTLPLCNFNAFQWVFYLSVQTFYVCNFRCRDWTTLQGFFNDSLCPEWITQAPGLWFVFLNLEVKLQVQPCAWVQTQWSIDLAVRLLLTGLRQIFCFGGISPWLNYSTNKDENAWFTGCVYFCQIFYLTGSILGLGILTTYTKHTLLHFWLN